MRLALYQPDIPQNTGALMRLGACFQVPIDLIGPYGFTLSDRALRRAGMDYLERASITEHASWAAFQAARQTTQPKGHRLILLTTKATTAYTNFSFSSDDILLLGSESAGVPLEVDQRADHRLRIPIAREARSLNVAMAGAIVLSEALRQTDALPADRPQSG